MLHTNLGPAYGGTVQLIDGLFCFSGLLIHNEGESWGIAGHKTIFHITVDTEFPFQISTIDVVIETTDEQP